MISVIIPTYQRVNKLKRAINSVINQSYDNYELIIVNDCIDDDSLIKELIESYKDSRIKYYLNSREKGANGARNTGILNAQGEFIAFLDDDDEWLENKLKTQLKCLVLKGEEWGGVYSSFTLQKKNVWEINKGNSEGDLLKEAILGELSICTGSNLLIRKKVIQDIGMWDEDLLRQQDLEFIIRLMGKYKLAYDKNLSVKIYGHNTPNPSTAFSEREKYLNKILLFLKLLSNKELDKFYSNHFRRQALYLAMQGKNVMAIKYWFKSTSYQIFNFKKDIKLLFCMAKGFLN